ncbi:MAG: SDR family NAD(P)-dependent oxidoreductase, partial [Oscillospiraceae bacterium]|nr:SDR family NAD(P)-dependent oxidoreductase [Oscillospiraceae bacterium]
MFKDKVVVITGGAGGIGNCIREEFEKAGAKVCIIDIAENPYFVGDIGDEAVLRRFAEKVIAEHS